MNGKPASKQKKSQNHRTRVGQERSARTEARILEAALSVFADMGPEAPVIDDFVKAAGISRGTFYNYFQSVEELLEATSEWTTRELLGAIDITLSGIEGPLPRICAGTRLFYEIASANPVWSRFVARVWKIGGLDLLARDLDQGIRQGVVRVPDVAAAQDYIVGAAREALMKIGTGRAPAEYGVHMAELCLQALGVDRRSITAALKQALPPLPKGRTWPGLSPETRSDA